MVLTARRLKALSEALKVSLIKWMNAIFVKLWTYCSPRASFSLDSAFYAELHNKNAGNSLTAAKVCAIDDIHRLGHISSATFLLSDASSWWRFIRSPEEMSHSDLSIWNITQLLRWQRTRSMVTAQVRAFTERRWLEMPSLAVVECHLIHLFHVRRNSGCLVEQIVLNVIFVVETTECCALLKHSLAYYRNS